MPKQILKLDQFHGGLSSGSDPRDIADNELSVAKDVMVDELGKIRTMGGTTAHKSNINAVSGWTGTLISGYGLFYFSHDRTGAEDAGQSTEAITGDNYLAIYDGNDGQVWIYSEVVDDAGGTGWDDDSSNAGNGVIDIGSSNTTTAQVSYYSVDGSLRICDGLHSNSNTPQWYGYTHRSHFVLDASGIVHGTKVDYSKWVASVQQMSAPTRGLIGNDEVTGYQLSGQTTGGTSATVLIDADAFTGYTDADFTDNDYIIINEANDKYATISSWDSIHQVTTTSITDNWDHTDNWHLYPASGTGFNVNLNWTSSPVGTWGDDITYEFAASFVYDGNQETELYYYNDVAASINNNSLFIGFYSIGNFDSRYTDFRLYYRQKYTAPDSSWLFLAEVSLAKGALASDKGGYAGWNDAPSGGYASNGTTIIAHRTYVTVIAPPTSLTYEIKSGMPEDKRITSPKYKTAVVANRRAYIGNVQYTDYESIVQTKGDAVLKSPVNQFDVFSLLGLLEASVNDGDNIVKLETYADRLLIFKKNKMELVNISQELEFLEDIFMHKGVSHPAATCKTDFGIAWVNNLGCYLYDGKVVTNLLEKKGRQIIKESDWETFTNDPVTKEPMIGYIPKKRQIIVVDDITTNGDGSSFLYDMVTQSWVKGDTGTITDQNKTNFVTDWNGDLVYAHTAGTVLKWADDLADATTATSSGVDIRTKDIDFGHPGQRKKVYSVHLTYKCDGVPGDVTTNTQVTYATDGSTVFGYAFSDVTTYFQSSVLKATEGEWLKIVLKPDTPSESNNIQSFRLRIFSGAATPATFEINDISIVFRLKPVK